MDNVKIALAKGRTADEAVKMLALAGIEFADYNKNSRKLVFKDTSNQVEMILVKSGDVPIYVEKGAADIGIVGKDILLEEEADVFEVLNLEFGKCRMCVCGRKDFELSFNRKLIVASKYPRIAKNYFDTKGIHCEVIKLNGSVELAPIIGLADVIVDIVESGKTLKENHLEVLKDICDISTRLIVNKVSLKTKSKIIKTLITKLEDVTSRGESA
jgi:ATP phosphoribosyltransferase